MVAASPFLGAGAGPMGSIRVHCEWRNHGQQTLLVHCEQLTLLGLSATIARMSKTGEGRLCMHAFFRATSKRQVSSM
jgi:hypothetical protein